MKAQTVLASIAVFLAMATVSAKEGFYSVTRDADGIWWGVRPDGAKFVPNGVAHVNLDAGNPNAREVKSAYGQACLGKYGSSAAWTTNALARLRDWGFNIVCCDSDYDRLFKEGPAEAMGFGYAYGLYSHRPLQRGARRKDQNFCITPQDGITCGLYFPNVFHPDYERITDEYCAEACGKRKDDRALFGYFISNELAWGGRAGDMKSGEGLFDYVNEKLDPSHPARQALERIVAACGGDRTSPATKEKFLEAVAERYFSVNAAAIRRHDPNHLVLGCRFAGLVHPAVIRIAGKYCDVVTLNFYRLWASGRVAVERDVRPRRETAHDHRMVVPVARPRPQEHARRGHARADAAGTGGRVGTLPEDLPLVAVRAGHELVPPRRQADDERRRRRGLRLRTRRRARRTLPRADRDVQARPRRGEGAAARADAEGESRCRRRLDGRGGVPRKEPLERGEAEVHAERQRLSA